MPSFEDLWREHRRFIVAVGVGLIVFLVALSMIWSVGEDVRAIVRQNGQLESQVGQLVEEVAGEGFAKGVALTLESDVTRQYRNDVEFRVRPAFTLKEGDSPFIVYRQAIDQVEEARAAALRHNIACPDDLGFLKDPPEDRLRVYIAGADLAERVLSALVDAGVKRVETFRPAEPDYVRILDEKKDADRKEKPDDSGTVPLLRRSPLRVAAVGTLEALERFLAQFEQVGSCLELASLHVVRAQDGLVRFEVELAGLALVPAAEGHAAKQPSAASSHHRSIFGGGGRR